MSRINVITNINETHEGGPAKPLMPLQQLRRSVLSCLLWEDQFYEDGKAIADRIVEFAEKVNPADLATLAIEARKTMHLRHAPLLLLDVLSKTGKPLMSDTTARVISRVDEMAELLAIYWRNGRKCIPRQMRLGLQRSFSKFDEYQFAKYDRKDKIKLRDVLRLARPKPTDEVQSALFKKVKDGTLDTPDTWEVALSGGADKKETFERLIRENRLGYFALLRNLRNMAQAGVDAQLVEEAVLARRGAWNVLPFRYVAAARAVPQWDGMIDQALQAAIKELPQLSGKTAVLVDVSGSMDWKLSEKSDLKRIDAAAALAAIVTSDRLRVFSFSNHIVEVAPRRGMAGIDAILQSQDHQGTYLGAAVTELNKLDPYERLIVITDEQTADHVPDPIAKHAYLVNVASYKHGVGYGRWTHIDGFSEGVLRYIYEIERQMGISGGGMPFGGQSN